MELNSLARITLEDIESRYLAPATAFADVRAYWVPIALRDIVAMLYRQAGIPVRFRYRGPRTQSIGRTMTYMGRTYTRTRSRAMQDCLRADATHFTVYSR